MYHFNRLKNKVNVNNLFKNVRCFSSSFLDLSSLTAVSPIDGRYHKVTKDLRPIFSEYGLIHNRVKVEIKWLIKLCNEKNLKEIPSLTNEQINILNDMINNFNLNEAKRVKEIEQTTRHDVKAVEYYLKEKVLAHPLLKDAKIDEFIHFATTSEDCNNLSYALMLLQAKNDILLPKMKEIINKLNELAHLYSNVSMMARTHGQNATPTTMGKELANFVYRLNRQYQQIKKIKLLGKLNGAVGNFNAHIITYPQENWPEISRSFIEDDLLLTYNPYTTQIEPHDYISELFNALLRFNTILLDMNRDMWSYISLGYYKQIVIKGEIGSSTMPHKVNPIDFENSEGNLGLSNAMMEFFANKLTKSRLQRDLSDSTVLRNLGVGFAYSYVGFSSVLKGLSKLQPNKEKAINELENNWQILAEAIQIVMKLEGLDNAYEIIKLKTRGVSLDQNSYAELIENLDISEAAKDKLKKLTPTNYLGDAIKLAKL